MSRRTKKILVVEEYALMRAGLVATLAMETDFVVCGQAGSAGQAMEGIKRAKPDLVLTELILPDKSGLELIKDIQVFYPGLPVLALSSQDEVIYAARVLRAGGRGYLMKDESPARLIEGVRAVLDGQIVLSARVKERLLAGRGPEARVEDPVERKLTDRELEVLRLFGAGWSKREVAERLHLSPRTVEVHRVHIKEKLGLRTAPEFLRFAIGWAAAEGIRFEADPRPGTGDRREPV